MNIHEEKIKAKICIYEFVLSELKEIQNKFNANDTLKLNLQQYNILLNRISFYEIKLTELKSLIDLSNEETKLYTI